MEKLTKKQRSKMTLSELNPDLKERLTKFRKAIHKEGFSLPL